MKNEIGSPNEWNTKLPRHYPSQKCAEATHAQRLSVACSCLPRAFSLSDRTAGSTVISCPQGFRTVSSWAAARASCETRHTKSEGRLFRSCLLCLFLETRDCPERVYPRKKKKTYIHYKKQRNVHPHPGQEENSTRDVRYFQFREIPADHTSRNDWQPCALRLVSRILKMVTIHTRMVLKRTTLAEEGIQISSSPLLFLNVVEYWHGFFLYLHQNFMTGLSGFSRIVSCFQSYDLPEYCRTLRRSSLVGPGAKPGAASPLSDLRRFGTRYQRLPRSPEHRGRSA